jgi:hypothetical protein
VLWTYLALLSGETVCPEPNGQLDHPLISLRKATLHGGVNLLFMPAFKMSPGRAQARACARAILNHKKPTKANVCHQRFP